MTRPSTTEANDEPGPREEDTSARSDVLFDRHGLEAEITPNKVRFSRWSSSPSGGRLSTAIALSTAVITAMFIASAFAFLGHLLGVAPWICFSCAVLAAAAVLGLYVQQIKVNPQVRVDLVNKDTGQLDGHLPLRLRQESDSTKRATYPRPAVRVNRKGKNKGKGKKRR